MVAAVSRRRDVTEVPRSHGHAAIAKAEEFLESADADLEASRWNSAGLAAVHAGIAAADTALIVSAGLRSASQDHGAVVQLLDETVPEFTGAQRRQLGGLLKMKNRVAYEQRPLTEVESRQLVDHARRLVRWARNTLEEHLPD